MYGMVRRRDWMVKGDGNEQNFISISEFSV
jgi:hypothetical protein